METEFKKNKIYFSYKTLLLLVVPIFLLAIKIIDTGSISLNLPLPILSAIPLIVIEAKYLSFFNRINLEFKFIKLSFFNKIFRSINTMPKTINVKKQRHKVETATNYIDNKVLAENYTVILAIATLVIVAIIFLYTEIL